MSTRLSIPWDFTENDGYVQRSWSNGRPGDHGHFVAVISRDGAGSPWSWVVRQGQNEPPLGFGSCSLREDAESMILETLGKAFARTDLPLSSLAADSRIRSSVQYEIRRNAMFYVLSDGNRVNLHDLHRRPVLVRLADGRVLRGVLDAGQWQLVISTAGNELLVHPSHVKSVELVP